MPSSQPSGVP